MQITALGHSCVLLDLDGTRILCDPWLSDHTTGDAMGRFPRVRLTTGDLGPIHAVFLSHAHSDHLDPYTLVRLWRELAEPPVLVIPVSLSFLLPVFHAFLDDPDVIVLEPHTPVAFRGVELLGFFDVGIAPTNEDDVMVLVVRCGAERVLVEADARLSLELPEFRAYITHLLRGPGITSAVYLTTENELTGTLAGRLCTTPEERQDLREYALDEMLQAVEQLYAPTGDPGDLWQGDHVLRLVHGQGLAAPSELDARWQRILFPVVIADRVAAERAAAERHGHRHGVEALTVGCVHIVQDGKLVSTEPVDGLRLLDREEDRVFDATSSFVPDLPCAPLRADVRDEERQRGRVGALLNDRFLPHLHGARMPPVLHLLTHGGYRVRVHYGERALDYVLGYGARDFVEGEPEGEPDEAYWANDLEDLLDGRCDEFTPFCRTQLPAPEMRLWVCLATPLLNSDLVLQRVRLHFERARDGLTPGSYVLPLWSTPAGAAGPPDRDEPR